MKNTQFGSAFLQPLWRENDTSQKERSERLLCLAMPNRQAAIMIFHRYDTKTKSGFFMQVEDRPAATLLPLIRPMFDVTKVDDYIYLMDGTPW